jgi:hypothetical protein
MVRVKNAVTQAITCSGNTQACTRCNTSRRFRCELSSKSAATNKGQYDKKCVFSHGLSRKQSIRKKYFCCLKCPTASWRRVRSPPLWQNHRQNDVSRSLLARQETTIFEALVFTIASAIGIWKQQPTPHWRVALNHGPFNNTALLEGHIHTTQTPF